MTKEFFKAGKVLGSSPLFVQGAGGNISVKQGGVMCVKASGVFLESLRKGEGYVCLKFEPIKRYLLALKRPPIRGSVRQESAFDALIDKEIVPGQSFGRPSIETGMHAVLRKYVFHTHNVYADILGCMRDGEKILKEIFSGEDILCLSYRNPGLALAHAIAKELKKSGRVPSTIFLLNHGIITHNDNFKKGLRLTLKVHRTLEKYFKARKVFRPFKVVKTPAAFKKHLFPDSVVYSQIDWKKLSPEKKRVFHEISSMTNYILDTISRLGGKPVFLAEKDVQFIKNMDKEKHRIRLMEKTAK